MWIDIMPISCSLTLKAHDVTRILFTWASKIKATNFAFVSVKEEKLENFSFQLNSHDANRFTSVGNYLLFYCSSSWKWLKSFFNFNQVNHKRHGSFSSSFFSGVDGKVHLSCFSLVYSVSENSLGAVDKCFDVKRSKSFSHVWLFSLLSQSDA